MSIGIAEREAQEEGDMNGIRGQGRRKVGERGQRAYMRRTIRCNFCKAEIHILSLKTLCIRRRDGTEGA